MATQDTNRDDPSLDPPLDPRAAELLAYWFGDGDEDAVAIDARMAWWFGQGDDPAARDRDLARRYGVLAADAANGCFDAWAATPRGRLALVLLLDQLPRNLHRGAAEAFACDAAALAIVRAGLALGHDRSLAPLERLFFYLPLQHAEDAALQELSVERYAALAAAGTGPVASALASALEYARLHRDIVARFGRFPYRNAVLGRADTPAEAAWLAAGAPDFGQGPRTAAQA